MQERVRGQEYDDLLDELIAALRDRYGARVIIHWEDFNVRNSFRLLDKYVAQVQRCILCPHKACKGTVMHVSTQCSSVALGGCSMKCSVYQSNSHMCCTCQRLACTTHHMTILKGTYPAEYFVHAGLHAGFDMFTLNIHKLQRCCAGCLHFH